MDAMRVWLVAEQKILGRDLLQVQHGWFADRPLCEAKVDELLHERFERRLARFRQAWTHDEQHAARQRAEWEVLAAAGITDPAIPDPVARVRPAEPTFEEWLAERPRVSVVELAAWPVEAAPEGDVIWLASEADPAFGNPVTTGEFWFPTEEAAQEACAFHMGVNREVFEEDRAELAAQYTRAHDQWVRLCRDWQVLSDAGLVPTFRKPEEPVRLDQSYEEWLNACLRARSEHDVDVAVPVKVRKAKVQ